MGSKLFTFVGVIGVFAAIALGAVFIWVMYFFEPYGGIQDTYSSLKIPDSLQLLDERETQTDCYHDERFSCPLIRYDFDSEGDVSLAKDQVMQSVSSLENVVGECTMSENGEYIVRVYDEVDPWLSVPLQDKQLSITIQEC